MSPMERFEESINTTLIEGMMGKQCLYYCILFAVFDIIKKKSPTLTSDMV